MAEKSCQKKMKSEHRPNLDFEMDSAIVQLELLHNDLDKLTEKENDEILQVEQKYARLKKHLYDKRSEIIETVPDYWFTVFTSHPDVCSTLTLEDEEILRLYFTKLEVDIPNNYNIKAGYIIKLYFKENPYFKNDILVKEFTYKNEKLHCTCSNIDWKKSYPSSLESKHKNGRLYRTFFSWFSDDEEPAADLISEVIKDDIWPNSLQYYLVPDPGDDDNDDDSSESSENDEHVSFDNNDSKIASGSKN